VPTHDELARFLREYQKLTESEQDAFLNALKQMVADLRADRRLHPSLRIKRVQGHVGVYELTWAANGRATFQYGDEVTSGEAHIIWRRIGTHDILKEP